MGHEGIVLEGCKILVDFFYSPFIKQVESILQGDTDTVKATEMVKDTSGSQLLSKRGCLVGVPLARLGLYICQIMSEF